MSIELELPPELESRLRREAELAGQDVDSYIRHLLGEQLPANGSVAPTESQLSDEQWRDQLLAWAESFPPVSHEVDDSRESIYEDRH